MAKQFLRNFVIGAATAAYQVEGATREDGRLPSIWDVFSHTPGKTFEGHTGDRACDQYHLFRDDIRLMKDLGLSSYRFSVSWSRIFPTGKGAFNQKGMDYYRRLVDELLAHDIRPLVTLYHWDLPQALEEQGGWLNRDTLSYFASYAETVVRQFEGAATRFITINEPSVAAYEGYLTGQHAPGHSDLTETLHVAHHFMAAHAYAAEAIRALAMPVEIGVALNLSPVYPASPSELDIAKGYDRISNQFFLDAACKGKYSPEILSLYGEIMDLSFIRDEDLLVMSKQSLDFLGVNYYFPTIVQEGMHPLLPDVLPPSEPLTDMGWTIDPQGLRELLVRIHQDYPRIPIYITENGAAFADEVVSNQVNDPKRIAFIEGHLQACMDAMEQGVDVRGYYVWSLLDNFEWAYGYSKRFGLVYVDYESMRRIPKTSAYWLRDWMMAHTPKEV